MIELNKIYNEDCLEGMKRIPDGSVDCVICDLPYGVLNGESEGWDELYAAAKGELPVRVTVDEAVEWVNELISRIDAARCGVMVMDYSFARRFLDLPTTTPAIQAIRIRTAACAEYLKTSRLSLCS